MELTQEYFDKGLINLLEKAATKQDLQTQLEAQTEELKSYTHDAFEIQQQYMEERFKEIIALLDVRERFGRVPS